MLALGLPLARPRDMGKAEIPAAPINGLIFPPDISSSSAWPGRSPMAVSKQMATNPNANTMRVWVFRKTGPAIVTPMEIPRSRVTTLAISFCKALTRRSATPLSRSRFPNISVPIKGVPKGAIKPVTSVAGNGKDDFRRLGNGLFLVFHYDLPLFLRSQRPHDRRLENGSRDI